MSRNPLGVPAITPAPLPFWYVEHTALTRRKLLRARREPRASRARGLLSRGVSSRALSREALTLHSYESLGQRGKYFSAPSSSCTGIRYEKRPPARKRRRSRGSRQNHVREGPSGAEMTPGGGFPTGFRTRRALRRRNDAGAKAPCAAAAGTRLPARKRRRKEDFRRNHVQEAPSGEKTAPEGGFPTGLRTRRALRRRNDAEAGVPDGITYEKRLPAPK